MAGGPVGDLAGMLAEMAPVLDARRWAFVVVEGAPPEDAFAIIREDEGTTAILADPSGDFARITLMVHSALDGVGLTAAVAGAMAERGIACNVVAGFHHDHLFVPWERGQEAMRALAALSTGAAAGGGWGSRGDHGGKEIAEEVTQLRCGRFTQRRGGRKGAARRGCSVPKAPR